MLITRGFGTSGVGEMKIIFAPIETTLPPKVELVGELTGVDMLEGTLIRTTPLDIELPED